MTAKLYVTLLAIVLVNCVRSDTVQLPVYGSGAFYYERYAHFVDPKKPENYAPRQNTGVFNLVEYLTVQMGIGNPVQTLNLTLDDFADDVLVFSDGAVDSKCSRPADNGSPIQGRRLFRSSRSTTFRSSGATKISVDQDRYFQRSCRYDDGMADSQIGSDDFKVAGKSAQKVPFAVVSSMQSTVQPFWPSDGVFSISQPMFEKSGSAVYRVASSIGQPQSTLYIKRTSGYARGDRVGTFTLGGRDTKNCDKTWTDLSLGSRNYGTFNTKMNSVSLGSADVYKNFSVASFEPRSSTISVPYGVFKVIGEKLGASFDPKTQFYVFPCDRVKDAPPLTLHMDGLEYIIPAKDYIRNVVPRSDNMCTVLMDGDGEEVYGPNRQVIEVWILGLPAMRSFCWNFDYDTNLVSVAKAIQDL